MNLYEPNRRLRRAAGVRTLAAALALAGCGAKGAAPQAAPPPPEVHVLVIEPRSAPLPLQYLAQVESPRLVEVRSKVEGFLEKRLFVEGGEVKEGDLLYLLDPKPFEAALAQAEGQLAVAKARKELARRDLDRIRPLAAENAVSKADLDRAASAYEQAAAETLSAQASVDKAQLDLKETRITAKISGRVGRALIPEGSLVTLRTESLLTTISQMDPVYVYFSVNDQDVVRWRRGVRTGEIRLAAEESADGVAPLPVEITLADGSSYELEGRMNFADPQIDAQTGTLRLRAEVPNPRRVLAPGMFVTVRVLGADRPDSILIPQRAVLQSAKGQFVYVVGEGGAAVQRPIRTSRWADEDWLVEEGLAAGDRLIVDGLQKIRDGAPVVVKAEAPPAGNAS